MRVTKAICPALAKSPATAEARRTLSARSVAEKPRSRLSAVRKSSPSTRKTFLPASKSRRSTNSAIVDLPEPERPVNQITAGECPARAVRSAAVTFPSPDVFSVIESKIIPPPLIRPLSSRAKRPVMAHSLCKSKAMGRVARTITSQIVSRGTVEASIDSSDEASVIFSIFAITASTF